MRYESLHTVKYNWGCLFIFFAIFVLQWFEIETVLSLFCVCVCSCGASSVCESSSHFSFILNTDERYISIYTVYIHIYCRPGDCPAQSKSVSARFIHERYIHPAATSRKYLYIHYSSHNRHPWNLLALSSLAVSPLSLFVNVIKYARVCPSHLCIHPLISTDCIYCLSKSSLGVCLSGRHSDRSVTNLSICLVLLLLLLSTCPFSAPSSLFDDVGWMSSLFLYLVISFHHTSGIGRVWLFIFYFFIFLNIYFLRFFALQLGQIDI